MSIPKNKRFHQFWNLNEGFFTLIPTNKRFQGFRNFNENFDVNP